MMTFLYVVMHVTQTHTAVYEVTLDIFWTETTMPKSVECCDATSGGSSSMWCESMC